jgi:PAS domain S-box-containing protein
MEWRHEIETKDLHKALEAEISEALVVQERELEMEGYIRGAELKAMQERRMLNSLVDSVVDSVISIDPRGAISRFNIAAEKQFGWSTKEVLDNKINIKEMMPMRYAVDHDDYIFNYLSTGLFIANYIRYQENHRKGRQGIWSPQGWIRVPCLHHG